MASPNKPTNLSSQSSSSTKSVSTLESFGLTTTSVEQKITRRHKLQASDMPWSEAASMGQMGIRNKTTTTKISYLVRQFSTPEMAARAHDVAALSIKGNSAILNFPRLKDSLPLPVSRSPRDVQEAAAKAAAMHEFLSNESFVSNESVSCDENGLNCKVDELGEIIELPSLDDGCFESFSSELMLETVDGWMYPSWVVGDFDSSPS